MQIWKKRIKKEITLWKKIYHQRKRIEEKNIENEEISKKTRGKIDWWISKVNFEKVEKIQL